MASGAMDTVECFSSLSESIPPWIERVSDLVSHTTAKHAEFVAEYSKLTATGKRPTSSSSRKSKNSSLHTHRDGHPPGNTDSTSPLQQDQPDHEPVIDPLTALRLQRYYQSSSRRNVGAAAPPRSPNNPHGPSGRNRRHLVVRYDSHAQAALEGLVRDIGGARNNIRKGRMNHMMKYGFGMNSTISPSRKDPTKPVCRASRASLSTMPPHPSSAGRATPFDNIDKLLESAQSLCETAAYQFLRNGDCSSELNQTKGQLSSVLGAVQFELERAKAEREEIEREEAKKADMKPETEETKDKEKEEAAAVPNSTVKKVDKDPLEPSAIIEVDDDSDNSSVSIDFGAFRRSRY